eukprot:scaffold51757_cov42-Cyclotella_meneghiniana.AAC.20
MSEEEFLERKQKALSLWARLLQITGGDLKPAKCFWYLLSYKFINGVARLRCMAAACSGRRSVGATYAVSSSSSRFEP